MGGPRERETKVDKMLENFGRFFLDAPSRVFDFFLAKRYVGVIRESSRISMGPVVGNDGQRLIIEGDFGVQEFVAYRDGDHDTLDKGRKVKVFSRVPIVPCEAYGCLSGSPENTSLYARRIVARR